MKGIALFGAGSPILADVLETCRRNRQPVAAAIKNREGPVYAGDSIPILDAAAVPGDIISLPFLVPLFGPRNRRVAFAEATQLGFEEPAHLVDCTTIRAGDCVVEPGAYVNAGCIIGSGTTLHRFVFCNRGANIGHHCRIGAFASIGPGAVLAGMVTVGDEARVGAGAIILPQVRIGSGAVVAPGAVVARDVPDGGFAAGNPARISARPPAKD